MFFDSIRSLLSTRLFTVKLIQSLELIITFVILYGIIFYLLMTADNKKYLQKQK